MMILIHLSGILKENHERCGSGCQYFPLVEQSDKGLIKKEGVK
jgi:hypothetical protein